MKKNILLLSLLLLSRVFGDDTRELYLDLMKKIVSNSIYEDASYHGEYNKESRENGRDHPLFAHTMIGLKRLNNIQECMEYILEHDIPGDCIETGVWRGGATIFMRAVLKAHNETSRKVWVADSFEGLPPPNAEKYPEDEGYYLNEVDYLSVSLESVRNNFEKYGLLDDQVVFLKGFFLDTLPSAPIEQLALLRLDGDLYESTMDALDALYPKLSTGGFVIIDDYAAVPGCRKAVLDYREKHGITDRMEWIDSLSLFWQKSH